MSLRDPHDQRLFRHFVKVAADGSIAAVVEVADGNVPSDANDSTYLEVTALHPYDFTGVTLTGKTPKALTAELATKNQGRGKEKDRANGE